MKVRSGHIRRLVRLSCVSVTLAVLALTWFALASARPDPDQLWRAIQDDLRAGRVEHAEAAMSRLLRLRPAAEEHWFVLARIALARGRECEALEALGHVGDAYPQAAVARAWERSIALRHRRARKAEEALLRAIRIDPRAPGRGAT